MHSFEVHSNESTCRKSEHLGLEQVIEYILGLMNYNDIRTHSSQHTIRIICVNKQVVPITPCQYLSG